MTSPLVSTIILNWNSKQYIQDCIKDVTRQTYSNIEVIIVDNGSMDGSFEEVHSAYPNFVYIQNQTNMGFAKGMNQGILASRGNYVLPLNTDVFLAHDFVETAVRGMEAQEELGAVSNLIYRLVDGEKTDFPRYGETGGFFLRRRVQGIGNANLAEEGYVFGPPGSCPFLRREMLEDVKAASGDYYDEVYFAGGEDIDLWFRMQLRGWRCRFFPSLVAWHVGSGSVDNKERLVEKPLSYQARVLRNRYLTIIKDFPCDLLITLLPYIILGEFAMWPYFLLTSPSTLLAIISSWRGLLAALPYALRKRRLIQRSMQVSSVYLRKLFVEF